MSGSPKILQAKHIPEEPILAFLRNIEFPASGNWYETVWANGETNRQSVLWAMPAGTPRKVALAKMQALIKRGLVDGCSCGCRGDFRAMN